MTKSKSETVDDGCSTPSSDTGGHYSADKSSNEDQMSSKNELSSQQAEKEVADNDSGVVENASPENKEGDSTTTATAAYEQQSNNHHDDSKQSAQKTLRSDPVGNDSKGNETEDCSSTSATKPSEPKLNDCTSSSKEVSESSVSNQQPSKFDKDAHSNIAPTLATQHRSSKTQVTSATESSDKKRPMQQQHHPSNNKQETMIEQEFDQDQYTDKNDTLLTMTFNQDGGCLAIGTASGFRICNVHPYQETFRRDLGFQHHQQQSSSERESNGAIVSGSGGIARIEMLYRTNLLALTGHHSTASHSQYPPNKVLIYDDHSQRTIGELSFRQKVLATKLRRDRIVVVLRDRVYVYNFSDLSLLDKVHTGDNPGGLIGLSLDNWGVGGGSGGGNSERGGGGERAIDVLGVNNVGARNGMVLACPSTQRGQVRVELYGLRRTTFIDAHESALGALALSVDGSLLATASERGTVIRLYDTRGVAVGGGRVSSVVSASVGTGSTTAVSSSVPLREFRRGVERATISCLTFSLDSCWLGCASDHGTVHIFQAQNNPNSTNELSSTNSNKPKPRSSSMTGKAMLMLPKLVSSPKKFLMDGEHSYAQVRGVPHPHACAFVPDRECTIAVAGTDDYDNGVLLLAEFGHREVTTCTAPGNGRGGSSGGAVEDTEAKRLGYHRFFKKGGAASMHGGRNRRSSNRSKDGKLFNADIVEGGAYVDDTLSVNLRMNHIRIGDENEDDFVPIDYDMKKY